MAKILGFPKHDITILTHSEIKKKAKDRLKVILDSRADKYDKKNAKEVYEKCLKEPLPYAMYRLRELFNYNFSYIGCEVTEEQYMEQLEVLPPCPFKSDIYSGYIVTECVSGDLYDHLIEHDNKFYVVTMPCQNKKAMATFW